MTTTDNKRIIINTFQGNEYNIAVRFQSILLDGQEENHKLYEDKLYEDNYEYKNDNNNESYLFKSQDAVDISKYSSTDSNGVENYNIWLIFNTSYSSYQLGNSFMIKQFDEDFKKVLKKKINLKVAVLIISNKTLYDQELNKKDTKESQEQQELEIMEFIAKYSQYIADENVLKIGHYSNKHFQKQFIINTICEIFSSGNDNSIIAGVESTVSKLQFEFKQFNESNNTNILETLVEKFYTQKYDSVELYNLLNGIEYTDIENKFTKQQELVMGKDSIIYFNLKQLYKVATIERNTSILLWLDVLLNIDQSSNKEELDIMINHGGIDGLMNRVAKCGDLSLFKLFFEKLNFNFMELIDQHTIQSSDKSSVQQVLSKRSYAATDILSFFYGSAISFLVDCKSMDIIEWVLSECVSRQCDKEIFKSIQTVILLKSAYNGDLDLFKFILSYENSLVTIKSCLNHFEDNITSIHWASIHCNLNIIKYIYQELKFDIKSNLKTSISKTEPIHIAAFYHHKELVDYFIDNKISNINEPMVSGETALYQAAYYYDYLQRGYTSNKYSKRLNVSKSFCDYLVNHHGASKICKVDGQSFNIDKLINQSSTCNIL